MKYFVPSGFNEGLLPHSESDRSTLASNVLAGGDTSGISSPLTFAQFYKLDISAPSVAQVILSSGQSLGQDATGLMLLVA